jgi:hypothetical protein
MINCNGLVQEGSLSPTQVSGLEAALGALTARFFDDEASFGWTSIPKGSGFTGGVPSTSALVSMGVPQTISTETRTALLNAICDVWMEHTNCSVNEIIASAINA